MIDRRPYVVMPIPFSNMILLVLDTLCPVPSQVHVTTWPVEHDYNESLACHKVHNVELPRRRPLTCINKHANVSSSYKTENQMPQISIFLFNPITGKYNRTVRPRIAVGRIQLGTDRDRPDSGTADVH